jgi:ketosteroid isomerase-like protein
MIDCGLNKGKSAMAQKVSDKSRYGATKKVAKKQEVDALRAADAAWLKAYQSKDAEAATAFYDKQGAMLAPNRPLLTGEKHIAEFIAKAFQLRDYEIDWQANKAEVAQSGELGYTSGTYEMRYRPSRGKLFLDKGKYLMVWKKQPDGSWKVLFDVSNSDLPPIPEK